MALGGADFSNPFKLHTFADRNVAGAQNTLTAGVLGRNNTSPQSSIDRLGKAAALKGQAYLRESYLIQQTQSNKEANKDSMKLAFPIADA